MRRPRAAWHRCAGRWLALLALAVQLAAASIVLPAAAQATASVDTLVAASICRGAPAPDGAPQHHRPACTICPLCQAVAQAGVLLNPPLFALAAPAVQSLRAALPPPARAPPARVLASFHPRGPPRLI